LGNQKFGWFFQKLCTISWTTHKGEKKSKKFPVFWLKKDKISPQKITDYVFILLGIQ
jgi:hypothetical protein